MSYRGDGACDERYKDKEKAAKIGGAPQIVRWAHDGIKHRPVNIRRPRCTSHRHAEGSEALSEHNALEALGGAGGGGAT